MKRVIIGIPTRGFIHYSLVWFLTILSQRKTFGFIINKHTRSAGANRNVIVKRFLEVDADYLLMMDDDNCPPPDIDIDKLISYDKDILVLPYPLNMNSQTADNFTWDIFLEESKLTHEKGSGLQKIYASGMGFVLIKRKVLESIEHPFAMLRDEDDEIIKEEDYLFCEKANAAGFEIWVDWDSPCSHFKEQDLLRVI